MEFFNESLKGVPTPNPTIKTCFSFALGCSQDFNQARQFWCGWVETEPRRQK